VIHQLIHDHKNKIHKWVPFKLISQCTQNIICMVQLACAGVHICIDDHAYLHDAASYMRSLPHLIQLDKTDCTLHRSISIYHEPLLQG